MITIALNCTVVELAAWDRQTDGRIVATLNAPPTMGGRIIMDKSNV